MQFLAGNWVRFGTDGNGDGRVDVNDLIALIRVISR